MGPICCRIELNEPIAMHLLNYRRGGYFRFTKTRPDLWKSFVEEDNQLSIWIYNPWTFIWFDKTIECILLVIGLSHSYRIWKICIINNNINAFTSECYMNIAWLGTNWDWNWERYIIVLEITPNRNKYILEIRFHTNRLGVFNLQYDPYSHLYTYLRLV